MNKIYRPSVRYDARYKDFVDRIKEGTNLDGAQIIRLALFVAASNPSFVNKLKEYSDREFKMPMPKWNRKDDNMWLLQQGEEVIAHDIAKVIDGAMERTGLAADVDGVVARL
jgi:hypothetical protein